MELPYGEFYFTLKISTKNLNNKMKMIKKKEKFKKLLQNNICLGPEIKLELPLENSIIIKKPMI